MSHERDTFICLWTPCMSAQTHTQTWPQAYTCTHSHVLAHLAKWNIKHIFTCMCKHQHTQRGTRTHFFYTCIQIFKQTLPCMQYLLGCRLITCHDKNSMPFHLLLTVTSNSQILSKMYCFLSFLFFTFWRYNTHIFSMYNTKVSNAIQSKYEYSTA